MGENRFLYLVPVDGYPSAVPGSYAEGSLLGPCPGRRQPKHHGDTCSQNSLIALTMLLSYSMIIHTNHTIGGKIMNVQNGKYAWMVKIGEKGQFVIPKEARDLFDLQPGNEILVLGDENRGLAILPKEMQKEYIARIFSEIEEKK